MLCGYIYRVQNNLARSHDHDWAARTLKPHSDWVRATAPLRQNTLLLSDGSLLCEHISFSVALLTEDGGAVTLTAVMLTNMGGQCPRPPVGY